MAETRILIVGAGPVGLVCALRLARAGIDCVLFEKSADLPSQLRATTFHPPTLDMLDTLGAAAPIIAAGVTTPVWQVLHMPSGEHARFDMSVLADVTRFPHRLQCEQYRLERVLLDMACHESRIELHLGAEVLEVGQDEAGVFAVAEIEGARRRFAGAYLVGADGAHSIVRQTIGLAMEGETYPSLTILTTTSFRFDLHMPDLLGANYVWGARDAFSMFRLTDEWRCTFYPRPGQDEDIELTESALQDRLHGILPIAGDYPLNERRGYRIHQRIVPQYRVGRIVLAGDAAHLTAPTGGMGMNGGIHDAFNLSDKLCRIHSGESADLLDVYSAERQPVAREEIIQQAHQNRTRMQEKDPAKQFAALRELQAIAADPARLRAHLLRTSMMEGLRRSNMMPLPEPA